MMRIWCASAGILSLVLPRAQTRSHPRLRRSARGAGHDSPGGQRTSQKAGGVIEQTRKPFARDCGGARARPLLHPGLRRKQLLHQETRSAGRANAAQGSRLLSAPGGDRGRFVQRRAHRAQRRPVDLRRHLWLRSPDAGVDPPRRRRGYSARTGRGLRRNGGSRAVIPWEIAGLPQGACGFAEPGLGPAAGRGESGGCYLAAITFALEARRAPFAPPDDLGPARGPKLVAWGKRTQRIGILETVQTLSQAAASVKNANGFILSLSYVTQNKAPWVARYPGRGRPPPRASPAPLRAGTCSANRIPVFLRYTVRSSR